MLMPLGQFGQILQAWLFFPLSLFVYIPFIELGVPTTLIKYQLTIGQAHLELYDLFHYVVDICIGTLWWFLIGHFLDIRNRRNNAQT